MARTLDRRYTPAASYFAKVSDFNPKGNQGGNLFLLTPKGTPRDKQENLHWFWDSILAAYQPKHEKSFAMQIISTRSAGNHASVSVRKVEGHTCS